MKRTAAAIILVGSVACTPTPSDSLRKIGEAASRGDLLTVEALVDIDRIGRDLGEGFREAFGGIAGDLDDVGVFGDALATYAVREIRAAVRERRLFEALLGQDLVQQIGAPTSDPLTRRQEPGVLIHEVFRDGDRALAAIRFTHAAGTDTGTVDLRLERRGRDWRVVGAERVEAYFESSGAMVLVRRRLAIDSMRETLDQLSSYQEIHWSETYRYADRVTALRLSVPRGVSVTVLEGSTDGWAAVATHEEVEGIGCAAWYGFDAWRPSSDLRTTAGLPVTVKGVVVCDQ